MSAQASLPPNDFPLDSPRASQTGSAPRDAPALRLWRMWRDGDRPDVFAFLRAAGPISPERLIGVLEVDQNERWQIGTALAAEKYFNFFRTLADDSRACSLIHAEMYHRQKAGEVICVDEYIERFPNFERQLRQLSDPTESTRSELHLDTTRSEPPPEQESSSHAMRTVRLRPDWAAKTDSDPEMFSTQHPRSDCEPSCGQLVGPYEIQSVLARGGMGIIYRAFDTQLKRPVALKMILAGTHADPVALARFRGEAEAVGRLQHPNIVQIYQVGQHGGLPFLALEFVAGQSMHHRIGGRPLAPADAARLTATLARAVEFAHQRGIIHRDLKPGNILLDCDGQPKITDFGLAKLHREPDPHSLPGEVIGTPNYMAPEQAEGTADDIGPAADVYSLGAVLYELLTGQPPFHGGSPMETLLRVRLSPPVPPTHYESRVPDDLEAICLKCLRKDRYERYPSAADLADELDRFCAGLPVMARAIGPIERVWKWANRHPARATVGATLVVLLVVAYALAFFQWHQATVARQSAQDRFSDMLAAQERLTGEKLRAETASHRSDRFVYTQMLASADRDWLMHDAAAAGHDLASCPAKLRGWEWHLLRRQIEGTGLTVAAPPGLLVGLTALPNGREFGGVCRAGQLHFWEVSTGRIVHRHALPFDSGVPPGAACVRAAFSTDGRFVAAAFAAPAPAKSRVGIWRVASGESVRSWECADGVPINLTFSDDGRQLAWTSGTWAEHHNQNDWLRGEVRVVSIDRGTTVFQLSSGEYSFIDAAFTPDGTRLATTGRNTALAVFDLLSGAVLVRRDDAEFQGRGLRFLQDGSQIAVQHDQELVFFSTAGDELSRITKRQGGIDRLFVSPNGKRLATAGSSNTVRVWDSATRQEILHLAGHTEWVTLAAFTPDNSRMITHGADGRIKVWNLEKDPEPPALGRGDIVTNEWIPSAAFDNTGERLFAASDKKKIRAFGSQTGEPLFTLMASDEVRSIAVSPDGQQLAAGYDSKAGHIAIWNLATHSETIWPGAHSDCLSCVAYSPDGSRLASASEDGTAKLWDVASGKLLFEMRGHTGHVNYVAFHPAGGILATAGEDTTVRLWDASDGHLLWTLAAHKSPVTCAVFSPDGRQLATANHNRDKSEIATQIHIWDVSTGRLQKTLTGHRQSIWHLAYNPDGTRLVSAGEDHTVRVWDPVHGELRLTLKWHGDDVRFVAFSRNGQLLASCGDDPFIRLWDATPLE